MHGNEESQCEVDGVAQGRGAQHESERRGNREGQVGAVVDFVDVEVLDKRVGLRERSTGFRILNHAQAPRRGAHTTHCAAPHEATKSPGALECNLCAGSAVSGQSGRTRRINARTAARKRPSRAPSQA